MRHEPYLIVADLSFAALACIAALPYIAPGAVLRLEVSRVKDLRIMKPKDHGARCVAAAQKQSG